MYYRNKETILKYIERMELYKKFGRDMDISNKSFIDAIKCFESTGFVDINLVYMYIDTVNKLIKDYNDKICKG